MGTYSSFKLSDDSARMLLNWCKSVGINNLIDSSEYHVTTMFSRENVEGYTPYYDLDGNSTIDLDPKLYSIGTLRGKDQPTTALVLFCPNSLLYSQWSLARSLGATWDYEDYNPHITLSYDVDLDLASSLIMKNVTPTFSIRLS